LHYLSYAEEFHVGSSCDVALCVERTPRARARDLYGRREKSSWSFGGFLPQYVTFFGC
jgi:hypothetical protein